MLGMMVVPWLLVDGSGSLLPLAAAGGARVVEEHHHAHFRAT